MAISAILGDRDVGPTRDFFIGASSAQRFTESGCHRPTESSDKVLARQPPACHPCRTETAVRPNPPVSRQLPPPSLLFSFVCECNVKEMRCLRFRSVELIGWAMHSVFYAALRAVAELRRSFSSLQRVLVGLPMDEPTSGNFGLDGK